MPVRRIDIVGGWADQDPKSVNPLCVDAVIEAIRLTNTRARLARVLSARRHVQQTYRSELQIQLTNSEKWTALVRYEQDRYTVERLGRLDGSTAALKKEASKKDDS
ncbi:hypothetical protein GMRT_jh003 [Giardia muris]|uniref:Uncharacterized protein n=1 Tax=Giardia muris TaxID=5742 RepID=A0A4Z1SW84_GIAMU|nr:hypothetical protein GMRT_jh003 [Giardia muris]|eukprot:TNJ29135.1 hypothetical protein GMRT_jh003 [Giardia muris]